MTTFSGASRAVRRVGVACRRAGTVDARAALCPFHHFCAHEGGFDIVRGNDGTLLFLDPDGQLIEPVPPAPGSAGADALAASHAARGLAIEPHTNLSRWDGRPLDRETLGMCVSALLRRSPSLH